MRSEIRQTAETVLLELGIDDDMLGKVTVNTTFKWGEQVKFHDIELSLEDLNIARKAFDELYKYHEVSVKMSTDRFNIRNKFSSYGVVFKIIKK